MPIVNRFAEFQEDIVGWRHDFHRHPELLYDVHWTAAKVSEKLRSFGLDEVVTGIGRTGVVGVIRGRKAGSGKVVGLRADMDALPIREASGKPYASEALGRMHACGHDGHSAMLLGAARYLAETRNFDGTAIVIFQPAEEGGAGGKAMVADGLMERWNIQEVYGMHNMPGLAVGSFATRPGPLMAATDEFTVTVNGLGGHAARPSSSTTTATIRSRAITPSRPPLPRGSRRRSSAAAMSRSTHRRSWAARISPTCWKPGRAPSSSSATATPPGCTTQTTTSPTK